MYIIEFCRCWWARVSALVLGFCVVLRFYIANMSFGVPAWLSFVALYSWFLASEFIIIIFLYSDSCFDLSF